MKFSIKIYLSIVSILFSISETLIASHAGGGEITYRCLGNYQYEIHFTFFRDCAGINVSPQMTLNIENSCGYPSSVVNLDPTPNSPGQLSLSWLCPSALSTCDGGLYTGMEKWDFVGIITLPGECNDWTFSHSEGFRNSALTTITGGGVDNLFVYATLNNTNGLCRDSPEFMYNPIALICIGQQFCFDNGVSPVPGDSITFQLITPRTGPTSADTVSYLSGYSTQQPLISNPPMSFNSTTGDICIQPTQQDVTPIAILVRQYLNGILVGEIDRDMQINISTCNNNIPVVHSPNNPTTNFFICPDQNTCITFTVSDADIADTAILVWDKSIWGVTEFHHSSSRDTMTLCWTPTIADIDSNPHFFTVSAIDNSCPYLGINSIQFCLIVDSTINCTTSNVPSFENQFSFKIFPQPATNKISFDLGGDGVFRNGALRIFDSFGRTVYTESIQNNQFSININLISGIYYADVMNENKSIHLKKLLLILSN